MFQRPYFQQLSDRSKEPRKFIQVLMGPRQVGKSTAHGAGFTVLKMRVENNMNLIKFNGIPWKEMLSINPSQLF